MIRVVIADDQPLLRSGFRMLLDAEPDIEVVGEAANGAEAVQIARTTVPDVVLMDIQMPELDGIQATRQITSALPDVKVIVLTMFDLDEYVFASLEAGASAFLLKDAKESQFLAAVRVCVEGGSMFAPSVTRRLIEKFAKPATATRREGLPNLTEREREVLVLMSRGLSNDEISAELVVSVHTTKSHVASVLQKLRVRSRVQAVVFAYEHGLVAPGRE